MPLIHLDYNFQTVRKQYLTLICSFNRSQNIFPQNKSQLPFELASRRCSLIFRHNCYECCSLHPMQATRCRWSMNFGKNCFDKTLQHACTQYKQIQHFRTDTLASIESSDIKDTKFLYMNGKPF